MDPALAGKLVLDLLKRIGQSDPERAVASLLAVKGTTVLEGCARLRHEKSQAAAGRGSVSSRTDSAGHAVKRGRTGSAKGGEVQEVRPVLCGDCGRVKKQQPATCR